MDNVTHSDETSSSVREVLGVGSLNLVLYLSMVFFAFPVAYLALSSSFSLDHFYVFPPRLLPAGNFLSNMTQLLYGTTFPLNLLNSVLFAGISTVAIVIISALAGYVFAMLAFPGKDTLFYIVLLSLAIPFPLVAIPLFALMLNLGFVDTYVGLIAPAFFYPIGILILRQSMEQALIEDVLNSARIDGASEFQIFYHIVLPLSKPGIAAVAVIAFIERMNGLFWPLVITRSEEMAVGTVFIANQQGPIIQTDWTVVMPASLFLSLAPLIVYFTLQRYFIKGILAGAVKQ